MKIKKSLIQYFIVIIALLSSFYLSACDLFSTSSSSSVPSGSLAITNGESITLAVDETAQLEVELVGISGTITYESNFPAIAKVDERGLITAQRVGTTQIIASIGGLSDSIEVTVIEKVMVNSIQLSISHSKIRVGETTTLIATITPQQNITLNYEATKGNEFVSISGNQVTALASGEVTLIAKYGDVISNEVQLSIYAFEIAMTNTIIQVGEYERLQVRHQNHTEATIHVDEEDIILVEESAFGDLFVTGLKEGTVHLYLEIIDKGMVSNTLTITIIASNPYENVNKDEFYANYTRASSYVDAMYRSECHLMSGDIQEQDQEPTISNYRPSSNGMFIHNSTANFSLDGNTYYVYDAYGNLAFEIYKDAAYVTLEEVAAYIYAFGDVPINYYENRYDYPQPYASEWGKYLRLNNSFFSGDTEKYPYEPELPRIYGIDGDLRYYEVDIGTTGTDCDPRYPAEIYNDGNRITRGAARIVYSRYYADGTPITDLNDRYVFYTYNHYNDFQEYLNYEGGWGEMFGNITGGGPISDYDPNFPPTPYVPSVRQSLVV